MSDTIYTKVYGWRSLFRLMERKKIFLEHAQFKIPYGIRLPLKRQEGKKSTKNKKTGEY